MSALGLESSRSCPMMLPGHSWGTTTCGPFTPVTTSRRCPSAELEPCISMEIKMRFVTGAAPNGGVMNWSGPADRSRNEAGRKYCVLDNKPAGMGFPSLIFHLRMKSGPYGIVSATPSIPKKTHFDLVSGALPRVVFDGQAGRRSHPRQALVRERETLAIASQKPLVFASPYHYFSYSRWIPITTHTV